MRRRKGRPVPGWTTLREPHFKAAVAAAMMTEPDLCRRLRIAIIATTARRGVDRALRDQFVRWVDEVEAAAAAMSEAQRARTLASPSLDNTPIPTPHATAAGL